MYVILSNLTASLYFLGSLSYTPFTFVAFIKTSAFISAALKALAVSVEKKGLPLCKTQQFDAFQHQFEHVHQHLIV